MLIVLLTGCQSSKIGRFDYSYQTPFAIGKVINHNGNGRSMIGHYISTRFGLRDDISQDFDVELSIGPAAFFREGGMGQYYGIEATPRLTYTNWFFRPYLEGLVGVGYLPHKWEGEATNHQFSVGGALGITIPINKQLEFDLGYKYYHISNGSAIFGSPRPNDGYNSDGIVAGITYKF